MSAYLTHLSFGIKNYQCMEKGVVKDAIKKHRHAYFYGLAGPDIFFYDIPNCIFGKNRVGCTLHEMRSGAFIRNLLLRAKGLRGEEKEIALAYIAGFICHYEIDGTTHGYLFQIVGDHTKPKAEGRHFQLEAAYDVYAAHSILGRMPSKIKQNKILFLNQQEKSVVTELFVVAYERTFKDLEKPWKKALPALLRTFALSKFEMKLVYFCTTFAVTMLHDFGGLWENILGFLEKKVLGYQLFSPLFSNDKTYDVTVADWAEYRSCCEDGLMETLKVMDVLEQWSRSETDSDFHALMQVVGNKSYHSGLPLEESQGR